MNFHLNLQIVDLFLHHLLTLLKIPLPLHKFIHHKLHSLQYHIERFHFCLASDISYRPQNSHRRIHRCVYLLQPLKLILIPNSLNHGILCLRSLILVYHGLLCYVVVIISVNLMSSMRLLHFYL